MAFVVFANHFDLTMTAMAVIEDGGRIHTHNPRLKAALQETPLDEIEDMFNTQAYMVGKFSDAEALEIYEKAWKK